MLSCLLPLDNPLLTSSHSLSGVAGVCCYCMQSIADLKRSYYKYVLTNLQESISDLVLPEF